MPKLIDAIMMKRKGEMPEEEMPMEEEQVEESPTDIRRRMMEQYLQQA